jgi:putative membrane protein insertion efficiency factor
MKIIIIYIVKLYQKILSPDHSFWAKWLNKTPYCKHIPTCSEYMIEAVEKKWTIIWVWKGIWRIFRCMPWNKWWYDPVIKTNKKIKWKK